LAFENIGDYCVKIAILFSNFDFHLCFCAKNKSCFAHNWPPHLVWWFLSHWRYGDITTFFTVLISWLEDSRGSTWSGDLLKTMIYPSFNSMGISKVQKLEINDPKVSWYCHNVNGTKVTGWQMRKSKIWTKTSMIFS